MVHSLFVPLIRGVVAIILYNWKADQGEPIPLFIDRHTLHIRTQSLLCAVKSASKLIKGVCMCTYVAVMRLYVRRYI